MVKKISMVKEKTETNMNLEKADQIKIKITLPTLRKSASQVEMSSVLFSLFSLSSGGGGSSWERSEMDSPAK